MGMSSKLVIFLNSCLFLHHIQTENLETIIETNIERAKTYEFPEKNNEIPSDYEGKTRNFYGEYDFVIIGAGSAGSVVANRLSEIKEWKILLLEAGDKEDEFTEIPDMMFWSLLSERNWGYYTTPQKTCCQGMKSNRCFYPRGKIIGGTSTVNGLMYVRGNPNDFNGWSKLGNIGWSYNEVLPYFKKSENYSRPNQEDYHGYEGPMNVEYARPESQYYSLFVEANNELNIHHTDYNGKEQTGYSKTQFNLNKGKRMSTGRGFLNNLNRDNLKISTKSFVTKIIFTNETSLQVDGVEFVKNDKIYFAKVKHEIILSAGAINSPQILILSGIGPKEHLKNLKISVRKNLPVGENLKDHISFFGLNFKTNLTGKLYSKEEILQQFLEGKGDLTVPANDIAIGFHKTNKNDLSPDIEYILVPPSSNPYGKPGNKIFNADENLETYLNQMDQSSFTIFMIYLHPKSTGSVRLKSNNPADFPLIDLNFFSDVRDLETMYEGIKFIKTLISTKSFSKIGSKFIKNMKNCDGYPSDSKEYWICALRNLATSSYHPISTTKMGISDKNSVVNTNLKVHGVDKLRVVDCGVFPTTTSGHPHAVAMMIAEKISDEIKREYKDKM